MDIDERVTKLEETINLMRGHLEFCVVKILSMEGANVEFLPPAKQGPTDQQIQDEVNRLMNQASKDEPGEPA